MKTPLPKKLVSFERRARLKSLRQKITRLLAKLESIPPEDFSPSLFVNERAKLISLYAEIENLTTKQGSGIPVSFCVSVSNETITIKNQ